MKVLFFIHSLSSGGAERVTINLANYWSEKGWDVIVVTMRGVEHDFYTLHTNVRRATLGIDVESANPSQAIMNNLRRVFALRKLLISESPDVAVAMMSTANILLALANIGTGVTAIGSERIHPPEFPIGRAWSLLRRMTYKNLAVVVAQTNASANWLRAETSANRVTVIPNPVSYPLAAHEPRVNPDGIINSSNKHLLLAVGRLEKQKGFDHLLTAFSKLSVFFPYWCLTILGEGTCRKSLEKKILELDLKGKVYLPGAVGNMSDWYKAADVYVMTSQFEGFPNTLVEALAHGVPAVSFDCETGPSDIIRHDVDGLLVPQNNQGELIDALTKLMSAPSLRHQYAKRAIEVRSDLSIEKVACLWQKTFEEAIK